MNDHQNETVTLRDVFGLIGYYLLDLACDGEWIEGEYLHAGLGIQEPLYDWFDHEVVLLGLHKDEYADTPEGLFFSWRAAIEILLLHSSPVGRALRQVLAEWALLDDEEDDSGWVAACWALARALDGFYRRAVKDSV